MQKLLVFFLAVVCILGMALIGRLQLCPMRIANQSHTAAFQWAGTSRLPSQPCQVVPFFLLEQLFSSQESPPSVVVAVMSSSALPDRMRAVYSGYGRFIRSIFFAVDSLVAGVPAHLQWTVYDHPAANVPSYLGAQWRSLDSINLALRVEPPADWIFLVDDDTFVNAFELRHILSSLSARGVHPLASDCSVPVLIGHIWWRPTWNRNRCWPSGGAGMLLSRPAALAIQPLLDVCWDGAWNDLSLGR